LAYIYRLLRGGTVSEKLLKIPLFGPLIHQLRLLGSQQHLRNGVLLTSVSTWGTENSLVEINLESTGVIKGCNTFWGRKLTNTCSFVGGYIIVQQEKISRAECSCTNLLNVLQEAIHYSFIKSCIYCFSVWYEFFVRYALRVENNYQHGLDAGHLEFQFLRPRGCHTNPFRTLSLCFRVIGKIPGLIFHNNFVKKIFVCIGHHDNVLAKCDLIFPLLRCQGLWNKMCTQLSLSQILFQNRKNYSLGMFKDSAIILYTI